MINRSIVLSAVPAPLKEAWVTPILNKPSLDDLLLAADDGSLYHYLLNIKYTPNNFILSTNMSTFSIVKIHK